MVNTKQGPMHTNMVVKQIIIVLTAACLVLELSELSILVLA